MTDLEADVSLRKDSPTRVASSSLAESSYRGVRPASRVASFTESVIPEMTRLSDQHGAINLAQGFPYFAAPAELKEAAVAAIRADIDQYPITWGARDLREAIAASYERRGWPSVDPATDVTVTCGSTEAMTAAFLGKVFGAADLDTIARLCVEHDLLAFTDEIKRRETLEAAGERLVAFGRRLGLA